jgi:predicted nucleic acid-binding protein
MAKYFFLDACALAKRYIIEKGSEQVNYLFDTVSKKRMITLLITLGEVISVIVRRKNSNQISEKYYHQAMNVFHHEITENSDIIFQSISDNLIRTSLPLIEQYSINATDAIILRCSLNMATILHASGEDLVLVTTDSRLSNAAKSEGLIVWNPENDNQLSLDMLI